MSRKVEKARWLVNRLFAMTPAEIAYRINQAGFRAWAKRQSFTQSAIPQSNALPRIPGFKKSVTVLAENSSIAVTAMEEANKILSSPFQAFGKTWPLEQSDERWHRDPESGNLWPSQKFCFDVDFRHRNGLGDAKYVWQRNKLQHLHWPAVHALLTNDKVSTDFCVAEIESWIRANPPYNGINWASGVECSYRILAFAIVCSLLPEGIWPDQTRKNINSTFARHGYWLERNLSLHSSANNHLIVELAGLFIIGITAPHLPQAKAWKDFARLGLQRETLLQFAPDGGSREQSPSYGAFSLEWLTLCARLAEQNTIPFDTATTQRIAKAANTICDLRDQMGNIPRIGDDDDATVLVHTGSRTQWLENVRGAAASIHVAATEHSAAKPPPHLLSCFGFVEPTLPPTSSFKHFADSGFTVMRKEQCGHQTMLVFDHGPLGYLSIAAHGHADALSIWVHRDGIPLIVDSGTYAYGADPEARNYFRGTTAHNTLTMSGQNSSQISGPFNWSRHAKCTVNSVDPKKFEISAEHDGFVGTNHRRKIMMLDDGFIVEDSLHNPVAPAPADVRFLLAPEHDVKLSKGSAIVLSRNREIMRVSCQGPLAWAGETKGNLDRNGWYSPCMGVRIAAVQLHLSGTLSSTDVQITRFVFPPKV